MKRLLFPLFLLLFSSLCLADECLEAGPCPPCAYVVDYGLQSNKVYLWGDVRVIPSDSREGADLYVFLCRKPNEVPELIVKWVEPGPGFVFHCGYWHRVERGEQFTVKFTDDFWNCDLRIGYGDPDVFYSCRGCPPGPF